MRGKTHEHGHAAHMHKHRAKGGNVEKSGIKKAGGNPYVEREAEEDKDGEITDRKHGGHAKKHRKAGGHIDGKKAKHRMDRAAGGRTALARGGHAHEKRDKEGEFEHKRARGGHVSGVEPDRGHGGVPRHHADGGGVRRARGGRTGSDTSPLSSANRITGPEPQPKSQEGGLSK